MLKKILKSLVKGALIGMVLIYAALHVTQRPSHDRTWELGQERLPNIMIDGNHVTIANFRDFDWQKSTKTQKLEAEQNYIAQSFQLDKIHSVDVIISHFDDFEGLAHIFLSFGITDAPNVVVSVETRREMGEDYSPLLGILRQYELMYVVGSEKDIVGLRTDVRGERLHVYPTNVTADQAQTLFTALAADINDIRHKPRLYNTITRNCTNTITNRVEKISDYNFPFSWKTVLPGYFDETLYSLRLIPYEKTFVEVKEEYRIDNTRVDRYAPDFKFQLRPFIQRAHAAQEPAVNAEVAEE